MEGLVKCFANHVPLSPISFLERVAFVYGDKVSIVYGDTRYSWRETRGRCIKLALVLSQMGLNRGDVGHFVMALAYLHAKGICHGNLENGIFVTDWAEENPRICLANFNTTADFGDGFKRDLQSLEYLVKTSVYYHCNQIKKKNSHPQEPAALVAFYDLFHQLESCENFEQMREFATFIYWAPVFYDWKDRRDFLICVDKFSNQAEEWFRRKLITSHSLSPKMLNWATRLNNLASDHLVVKLYDYEKNSKSYDYSGGLYLLHRNGLHHCMGTKDKDAIQRAMEELLRIFPEALSEIFAALIARFHFHKHDAFGKDLVMFLKEADNLRG